MGTQQSNPSSFSNSEIGEIASFQNDFQFIKSIDSDSLGELKIVCHKKDPDQNAYGLKIFLASTPSISEAIYKIANDRKHLQLETILRVQEICKSSSKTFCADYCKVLVLYEYCEYTVADDIQQRKLNNVPISDLELFNLVDCVLSALILFKQSGIDHGSVTPENIFITEKRIFKLNDILFMNGGISEYNRFFMGSASQNQCYLSPELLSNLKHRNISPINYDVERSDVFSLGLTVLEIALLKSINEIYDFDDFIIDEQKLNSLLNEVKPVVSASIFDLIKSMLRINYQTRPDYNALYNLLAQQMESLKDYKEEIVENHMQDHVIKTNFAYNINEIENKIKLALSKSDETIKKYQLEQKNIKKDLENDDMKLLQAKRETLLNKSNIAKETLKREKEQMNSIDQSLMDSNKLYDVYLEEYKKLKNKS